MPPMDLLEGLLRDFIATTKRKQKNKEMIYNKTQRTHCETKRKPRQTTKKNTKKDDSARSRNFLLDHSFRNVEVVVCDGCAPPKDRTAKAEATRQRISNDDDGNIQWIDSMTIAIMMETRALSVMVLPRHSVLQACDFRKCPRRTSLCMKYVSSRHISGKLFSECTTKDRRLNLLGNATCCLSRRRICMEGR